MNAQESLAYIAAKFSLDLTARSPIQFRLSRHGGLTSLWRELGFREIAEIGVEQGKFSKEICRDNPEAHLWCVDAWAAYSRYKDHVSQSKLDGFFAEAQERLKGCNVTFVRKYSMDAVKDFQPNSLDAVFIDGNHDFRYVVNDIIYWSDIVRPGGMVSGHDYRNEDKEPGLPFHVIPAVGAFCDAYKIRPFFVIRGDKSSSFFWIKQ